MKRHKIAIIKTDKCEYPKEGIFRPSGWPGMIQGHYSMAG